MKTVMLEVILLRLLWMIGELQVQPSNCPVVKLWSRTRRPKFLLLHCFVHVGRGREAPQPFHLGGAVSVFVTTPIESLEILSPCLKDSTSGEDNTHTIVPSDSNTMSNLGLASILTEDVRVHGAWSEFLNKFPDRKKVTFEETDGGLDRGRTSLLVLPSRRGRKGNTQLMIASCTMDWDGLQRHGLLVPKTRTQGSTTWVLGKVLLRMLSEVFMHLYKS